MVGAFPSACRRRPDGRQHRAR